MFVLEPIGWADCFTPEDLIEEIFHQLPDLSFPIPLFEIAQACGIVEIIDIANLPNSRPSGAFPEGFLIDENKCHGVIFYKDKAIAPYRKRFTIAHELAHFLLPHHINKLSLADIYRGDVSAKASHHQGHEKEADWFAGELLLPKHLLEDALKSQSLSLQFIKRLAETSQTSFSFLINRCFTILDEKPMAVIHSKDGVCYQIWVNGHALPSEIACSKKESLPDFSVFGQQQNTEEEHITEKTLAIADCWFNSLPDDFSEILYEQTYYQRNGYAITLLLIE
jgi:Zn-dependent peptidase ImmA (M78 family)